MRALILKGTMKPSRHAQRGHEPSTGGQPEKPAWLTGEGATFWDWCLGELTKMGVAQSVDSAELAAMCRWWAEWRRSDQRLEQMAANDDDRYRAIIQAGLAWKNFDKIAREFGLTPVARIRLATQASQDDADPLLDMLKRRSSSN